MPSTQRLRAVHTETPKDGEMYLLEDGRRIRREGPTTDYAGKWVLRDKDGRFIDKDAYRNDLMGRNGVDDVLSLEEYLEETLGAP